MNKRTVNHCSGTRTLHLRETHRTATPPQTLPMSKSYMSLWPTNDSDLDISCLNLWQGEEHLARLNESHSWVEQEKEIFCLNIHFYIHKYQHLQLPPVARLSPCRRLHSELVWSLKNKRSKCWKPRIIHDVWKKSAFWIMMTFTFCKNNTSYSSFWSADCVRRTSSTKEPQRSDE